MGATPAVAPIFYFVHPRSGGHELKNLISDAIPESRSA